ncbi:hypothetical protein JTE90_027475 [Oedothorax gibbosus]|uniref:BHLH domain-containing protein n=1 Tax=Oedothorax gibbosus TaxID=931172 RepID=A0AAV6UGU5_9ARAC|nr:hypothetical protein JTE90_027475 [Oedothorax gibbosus]
MSSGGKMPEYTLLTPLPLTPDVMPHDFEQLVNMGFGLPCELVAHHPHYSFVNMVQPGLAPTHAVNEDPRSPQHHEELDDDVDDDEDRMQSGCSQDGSSPEQSEQSGAGKDPFAPHCKIPLPTPFSPYEYWLEPSFIRRRNERERQRVRNVNDGFERLKSHIPLNAKDKDKRLSKVEILRMAIRYIRNLQDMLKRGDGLDDSKENMCMSSESED